VTPLRVHAEVMMHWIDAETAELRRSYINGRGDVVFPSVVIARTSPPPQHYSILELGPELADAADEMGMVAVERPASTVFNPQSVQSFNQVPVLLGHPAGTDRADPAQSVGRVVNPRRSGEQYLIADLHLNQRGADAVRAGWRGVSAGYDSSYVRIGPGSAMQRDIVADHVALLDAQSEPRCGDACYIRDSAALHPGVRQPHLTRDAVLHPDVRRPPLSPDDFQQIARQRAQAEQQANRAYADRVAAAWGQR
jgi:hypothetical protein